MADPHLHLFYSYDRGSEKDPDRIATLEDNITRGLLIVLQNMQPESQKKFLREILDIKSSFKNLKFDLQNIDDEDDLHKVRKHKNKILLVITRDEQNKINKGNINKGPGKKLEDLRKSEDDKKRIRKELGSAYKKLDNEEDKVIIKGLELTKKEISSLYEYLGDCRPDGWIYNENFAVLIEAKIGGNQVEIPQLYRHLTGEHGFNLKPNDLGNGYTLIKKTWGEIGKIISELISNNEKNKFNKLERCLINEFEEYLHMTNQIFNPYKNRNDPIKRTEQLNILVKQISELIEDNNKLKECKQYLQPKRKYSNYVGQQLGENEASHYNIHFNIPNMIGINLTLFGAKLSDDNERVLKGFLNNKTDIEIQNGRHVSEEQAKLMRYSIMAGSYRSIDKQQSSIRIDTVALTVNFYERVMNPDRRKTEVGETLFGEFFEIYKKYNDYFKQIDLSYNIEFFEWNNKTPNNNHLPALNYKAVIDEPDSIAEEFVEFIEETIDIAKEFGLCRNKKSK